MTTTNKTLQRLLCAVTALFLFVSFFMFNAPNVQAKTKTEDYLFIGNSLTGFNNQPEMFKRLVKAGKGIDINITTMLRGGRLLTEHAKAIEAVLRTEGDSANLTAKEKTYFNGIKTTTYSENMYQGYANCIYDKETKQKRHYDVIVLQTYFEDGSGDATTAKVQTALETIIRAFDSPDTTYVVEPTMSWYKTKKNLYKNQNKSDKAVKGAVTAAKKTTKGLYKNIRISYYGKSLCNYLKWYGPSYAQKKERKAFSNYKNLINDLFRKDRVHLTQLGTYITANTLYSTMYGNPSKASKKYKGGVQSKSMNADGSPLDDWPRNALNYRNGKGFKSKTIVKAAMRSAYYTQKAMPK